MHCRTLEEKVFLKKLKPYIFGLNIVFVFLHKFICFAVSYKRNRDNFGLFEI